MITIKTEERIFNVSNFVIDNTHTNVILVGNINEETPLTYWLQTSCTFCYNIEVRTKDIINLHIPVTDIIEITY